MPMVSGRLPMELVQAFYRTPGVRKCLDHFGKKKKKWWVSPFKPCKPNSKQIEVGLNHYRLKSMELLISKIMNKPPTIQGFKSETNQQEFHKQIEKRRASKKRDIEKDLNYVAFCRNNVEIHTH
ncbi:hypothetical protein LXL04_031141 [Taraxacum kok-saghyz]